MPTTWVRKAFTYFAISTGEIAFFASGARGLTPKSQTASIELLRRKNLNQRILVNIQRLFRSHLHPMPARHDLRSGLDNIDRRLRLLPSIGLRIDCSEHPRLPLHLHSDDRISARRRTLTMLLFGGTRAMRVHGERVLALVSSSFFEAFPFVQADV